MLFDYCACIVALVLWVGCLIVLRILFFVLCCFLLRVSLLFYVWTAFRVLWLLLVCLFCCYGGFMLMTVVVRLGWLVCWFVV